MEIVKIRELEVYHPENQVGNDFYIKHFNKQGKDIRGLLQAYGRDKRYVIDNDVENTVSMGIEAAQEVLLTDGLTGQDIDMVLFSSQLPEYTVPSQSLIVHNAISGKEDCMCLDTNANCVGMLVTVENTARAMLGNPYVKRALIIGADYLSVHCRKDDELTYSNFGDGAAAIILEKVEGEKNTGFIDGTCKTSGESWRLVKYPACGLSKIYGVDLEPQDKYLKWTPFDGSFAVDYAIKCIDLLLDRNNLTVKDINSYCLSQYAKAFSNLSAEKLGENIDKFIYIGDTYGYTGTSSPFIAFYEGIKTGRIRRGDLVCFWSVGTHWTICTILIRY